jgi:acetolactate synthase-1/2/3 large subunit
MPRGADIVARTLVSLGVKKIFTLSGNHIMTLFDALISTDIELVHVRHEAACVHMADAWGRLTGEVGVALVTGGQGHSNAAAALFTALSAESPMLLLSGHAGLRELGLGAFQELAQADIAKPMTKASWTSSAKATLAEDLVRGFNIAKQGRPGPVHISLPVDLLEEKTNGSELNLTTQDSTAKRRLDPSQLENVRRLIAKAARPLILCGPAMCSAEGRKRMRALEAASSIPVIGMESPRGLKDPSLGCFAEALAEADLLVLVGKQLDFTLKFGDAPAVASSCSFVVIDPDSAMVSRVERTKGDRLLMSALADPAPTLEDFAARLQGLGSSTWLDRVRKALAFSPPAWSSEVETEGRLHPLQLCRIVGEFIERHAGSTLVCDGGEIGQWPQAIIKTERRLINGVSGTIGASIPFAIAAKAIRPDAPAVAILGDGTFGFHMAEFDTALRHGLPIIAVVGNDSRWNAEYQIQLRSFGAERARYCDLLSTRYDQVVAALGGFGALATTANELRSALRLAHASGKPACINVMIESISAPDIRSSDGQRPAAC